MAISKKAFASITVLLFILFFLFITLENKVEKTSDFIIIKQVETRKESSYLNFERVVKNSLHDCESDPLKVKERVVKEIYNYGERNNFFILNTISKEKKEITVINTNEITKVIVYRPTKSILIKEMHLTKGVFYNKQLGFLIKNRKYQETFLFANNYFIREVVFC